MTNNEKTIGIIGGGMVGRAIASYFGGAKIYDKYKPKDDLYEVASSDVIFVAVPTPFTDSPDLTEISDAFAKLAAHMTDKQRQIVVIKSTIAPGTTDDLQEKYQDINIVFNPEFLTESTASEDFLKPDKQLVGYTTKTQNLAQTVLDILPDAPYKKILPAKVCELVKYAVNSYYAFKVIFGNQIFDLCKSMNINYDEVRQGLCADSRIIDSHFDVLHGGYRGFGGKCLPKDIKTLAWVGNKSGTDLSFIENIIKINEHLLAEKSAGNENFLRGNAGENQI